MINAEYTLSELRCFLLNANQNELAEFLSFALEVRGENVTHLNSLCKISDKLNKLADKSRKESYGKKVFFRGLIEISSYCKNNCYYCGLRKDNKCAVRYRLTKDDILQSCLIGYNNGFRTVVMQGGEDLHFNQNEMCDIIYSIKEKCQDIAITLSVGEKSVDEYKAYFNAGADRFLLRHETADKEHYYKMHPQDMSFENRIKCLYALKEIGFQTGAGFMVDSPYQTVHTLAKDLIFLRELDPAMIGIGPFIPHKDTPFKDYCKPTPYHTLVMLSLLRIMFPKANLPATTALNSCNINGRKEGLMAGGNVLMPNLSPMLHRKDYNLYDGKQSIGKEGAEGLSMLSEEIREYGFESDLSRGDNLDFIKQ